MILLDSSAWIEFLVDGRRAKKISKSLGSFEQILVPTLVFHEVGRYLIKRMEEPEILAILAQLQRCQSIPLSTEIAWKACIEGKKWKLACADSIIYATALLESAEIITLDNDFRHLPGVTLIS